MTEILPYLPKNAHSYSLKVSLAEIIDAILYKVKRGIQRHLLLALEFFSGDPLYCIRLYTAIEVCSSNRRLEKIYRLLSWLIPLIEILIKFGFKGLVFLKQNRYGVDHRLFTCFKFDSMKMNRGSEKERTIKGRIYVTKLINKPFR